MTHKRQPGLTIRPMRQSRRVNRWAGDIISPAQRSALMARIRGKDTRPERIVRSLLHKLGYRFRLHARDLPGRPDVVFRSRQVAVFIHGCFWHRHDCGAAYTPKTRSEFWKQKFKDNIRRDYQARMQLESSGWRVVVVWECQVEDHATLSRRLTAVLDVTKRRFNRGRPNVMAPQAKERTPYSAKRARPQRQNGRPPEAN